MKNTKLISADFSQIELRAYQHMMYSAPCQAPSWRCPMCKALLPCYIQERGKLKAKSKSKFKLSRKEKKQLRYLNKQITYIEEHQKGKVNEIQNAEWYGA